MTNALPPSEAPPWRRIAVHLASDAQALVGVRIAAQLAVAFDCELTGVATPAIVPMPSGLHGAASTAESASMAQERALLAAQDHLREFRVIADAAGVRDVAGVATEGDAATVLLHHALSHDLLVVAAQPPGSPGHRTVDTVLLRNPRPTLVLPPGCATRRPGGRVLLAWDGSPAAARAAADALPLLRGADEVHLHTWHPMHDGVDLTGHLRPVTRWLASHGVAARPGVSRVDGAVGDALWGLATTLEVDLVVMGAYGHARWMERLVGGATRTLLARTPAALLMSH